MNNTSSTRGINNQVNYNFIKNNMEEEKYPEVYRILHPLVLQMIADMENHYGNIEMTDEILESMIDGILERSSLLNQAAMPNMPVDNAMMPDAVPTISMSQDSRHWNNMRWDRDRGRCWGHHCRSSLGDITRILLLQQIFGGRRPRWRW